MIPADLEALALADTVGALDPDEQRDLAARVSALAPEEQAAVARLDNTVVVVVSNAPPPVAPPAHVRDRVMAATRTPGRYTLASTDGDWFDTPFAGIRGRVLAVDKVRGMATLFLRTEPGAVYPSHQHHGPEECYVLRGSVLIDGRTLHAGDFHHADDGSDHGEITTTTGADVLIVGAIDDYLPGYEHGA
jgi:ChrR Cupin-like domain